MKQQIIIIHGGTTFENYEKYINYLKNTEISLDRLKSKKGWKDSLEENLGEKFEVFNPRMPDSKNAKYSEWEIWFERIISLLNNDLILIGHSLGGIFLAKYLSENNITKKIKATILISAPFDDKNRDESLSDFNLSVPLSNFSKQCESIYLIHSKDDTTVQFKQVEKYKKVLPNAKLITFENRGHFNQETFPELIKLIKQI